VSSSDCFISSIDLFSKGTCPALFAPVSIDGRAQGALDEGNTLYGPFGNPGGVNILDAAIGPFNNTVDAVVRNNHILALGSSFGITLGGLGLMTAIITQNVVENANVGIGLQTANATAFDASIFLNDVIASRAHGISSVGPYTFPTELSLGGFGNYWDHREAPGFRPSDTNNPVIRDSLPFCAPITTPARPLPPTCP
jgi:hypothetical protein